MSTASFSKDTPWIQEWFFCIVQGGGQNGCSEIARPNLPAIGLFAFSEVLVTSLGVVLFGFFGARMEIIIFWKVFFFFLNYFICFIFFLNYFILFYFSYFKQNRFCFLDEDLEYQNMLQLLK